MVGTRVRKVAWAGAGGLALATSLIVVVPHASAQPAWTQATQVTAPSGANASPAAQFNAISCVAAGSCTAVGTYQDTLSHQQAMAAAETSGTWAQATVVTAPTTAGANPTATLLGISCSSAGNCTAAGTYMDATAGQQDMVATETSGAWAQATKITLPADAIAGSTATLGGISCTSTGNCTIVGSYTDSSSHGQAMVAKETSGTWGQATKITAPGNAATNPGANLAGISCYSAGNCTAPGTYDTSSTVQVMVAMETSGTWAQASEIALPDYAYPDITCTSAGNCVTGGTAVDGSGNLQAAITIESMGSWSTPLIVTAPSDAATNPHATINDVSCASLGNCLAVGSYRTVAGNTDAMVAIETDSTWAPARTVVAPGDAAANPAASLKGVSCSSTVDCAAAGTYSATSSGSEAMVASQVPPMPYTALSPTRVCDTRPNNPSQLSGTAAQCDGAGNTGTTMAPGSTLTIDVGGVPQFNVPANAGAVVLNVTVVYPTSSGFLTAFPAGQSVPLAANINFQAGQVVPNLVEVGLGPSGQVSLYSTSQVDVVVDLEGYTAPSSTGAGLYNPLSTPARVCDTRPDNPSGLMMGATQCNGTNNSGTTLSAGETRNVQLTGVGNVPSSGVSAVVLNVIAVNPASDGFFTVFPAGTTRPLAANLNFLHGQVVENRVIVPVSLSGQVAIYTTSQTDLIVDVSGWYSTASGSGTQFVADATPTRICDTRPGNPSQLSGPAAQCNGSGNSGVTLGPSSYITINVAGYFAVPTTAKAVVLNLTAVFPTANTYLTVYPSGSTPPLVADLDPAQNSVEQNLVVATLSGSGTFNVYNFSGAVDLVVDVAGWYS